MRIKAGIGMLFLNLVLFQLSHILANTNLATNKNQKYTSAPTATTHINGKEASSIRVLSLKYGCKVLNLQLDASNNTINHEWQYLLKEEENTFEFRNPQTECGASFVPNATEDVFCTKNIDEHPSVINLDLSKMEECDTGLFYEFWRVLGSVWNDKKESVGKKQFIANNRNYSLIELQQIIEAYAFLCSDLNFWNHFLIYISPHLHNLANNEINELLNRLIDEWQFLKAVKIAICNVQAVDKERFLEICTLFGDLFARCHAESNKKIFNELAPLKIELLRLFKELIPSFPSMKEETREILDFKIEFLKMFVKWFHNWFVLDAAESYKQKVKDHLCLVFFSFLLYFSPAESYNLHSKEFGLFKALIEHYLFSTLGFQPMSDSNEVLGVLDKEENTSRYTALRNSESFIGMHFKFGRKFWIHFGYNTIQRINENVSKNYLRMFWRVLRIYVVREGGDGILMTFGSELPQYRGETAPRQSTNLDNSEDIAETFDKPLERFPIMQSGFWNLVDPTLEGNVVFHAGTKMEIVQSSFNPNLFVLEIDGKNNLLCPGWETRSQIVLFYESKAAKDGQIPLIKALPGCMVSVSFDLMDKSGKAFDLYKIKAILTKMCVLNLFKVSVLFSSNTVASPSTLIKYYTCGCKAWCQPFKHKNESEAISIICEALNHLSEQQKTFRELSLELIQMNKENKFTELLNKLNLTSLQCINLCFDTSCDTQICDLSLSNIRHNKFMKDNLNYLDIFPWVVNNDFHHLLLEAPLKKVSLLVDDYFYRNRILQNLFKGLAQKTNRHLLDLELYFNTYYWYDRMEQKKKCDQMIMNNIIGCAINPDIIDYFNRMGLVRLSIYGQLYCCEKVSEMLFPNTSSIFSNSLRLARYFKQTYDSDKLTFQERFYALYLRPAYQIANACSSIQPSFVSNTLFNPRLLCLSSIMNSDLSHKYNSFISRYFSVNQ